MLTEFKFLLPKEVQTFISKNVGQSITSIAFQKNPFPALDWKFILNQIEAKTKAKDKLPTWFKTENIIYPSKISLEQTSSEQTATYKSNILSGKSIIDLTGGFGVDAYFLAKKFKQVIHCEENSELSQIVTHNFKQFQINNILCIAGNSEAVLKDLKTTYDWIYIDPSRRNQSKGKVFQLTDCEPNVPELQSFYFKFSNQILIKTAPLLDISAGLTELKNVTTIHIVSIENEVKELLWEIKNHFEGNPTIKTVNISKKRIDNFEFELDDSKPLSTYSEPNVYLYEPNAAIMKSGGFDQVSNYFKVHKLHPHSHLYTSAEKIDFYGRIFKIEKCFDYSKSEMKKNLENQKANITTRNFPESVENIRKKWKIKEGGELYCFFTTDLNNHKIVLLCQKLN